MVACGFQCHGHLTGPFMFAFGESPKVSHCGLIGFGDDKRMLDQEIVCCLGVAFVARTFSSFGFINPNWCLSSPNSRCVCACLRHVAPKDGLG